MKVYREIDIRNFEPWSGAVQTYDRIWNENKLDELEALIDELYPDGIDETQLNDILWFEEDWLYETLGIEDEEDEEDEDEEEESEDDDE